MLYKEFLHSCAHLMYLGSWCTTTSVHSPWPYGRTGASPHVMGYSNKKFQYEAYSPPPIYFPGFPSYPLCHVSCIIHSADFHALLLTPCCSLHPRILRSNVPSLRPCAHALLPTVEPSVKDVAAYGTATVAAAAVLYGCVQAKRKRDSAAVVDLYNALVDLPEPTDLSQQTVAVGALRAGRWIRKLTKRRSVWGWVTRCLIIMTDGPAGEHALDVFQWTGVWQWEAVDTVQPGMAAGQPSRHEAQMRRHEAPTIRRRSVSKPARGLWL